MWHDGSDFEFQLRDPIEDQLVASDTNGSKCSGTSINKMSQVQVSAK